MSTQERTQTNPIVQLPNSMETLLGYADVEVTYLNGEKETVRVRQFKVSECADYMKVMDYEDRAIAFLARKPESWADTLTVESWEKIITEGERLNGDFFSRWVQ